MELRDQHLGALSLNLSQKVCRRQGQGGQVRCELTGSVSEKETMRVGDTPP